MAKRIFISFAKADGKDIAEYAYNFYTYKVGFDVFYSEKEIPLGREGPKEIDERLKKSDVLLLIATREALESQNVAKEVRDAIQLEKTIIPCKHSTVKNWSDLKKLRLNDIEGTEFDTKEELIRKLGRLEGVGVSISQPDFTTIASQVSPSNKYDVFICHASEDKEAVARPLAETLMTYGLKIWYDDFSLKTGDSLREKIDYGLTHSDYGIIIVSKKFFEKNWPQAEFSAMFSKQVYSNKRIILPVWYEISREEVEKHSAIIADIFAQKSSEGIENIAAKLYKEIRGIERIYDFSSDTGLRNIIASHSKSIRDRDSLIKQTEQIMPFIILSKIYLIAKGYRFAFIYYQQLSDSWCTGEEERRILRKFMEDLMNKKFIVSKALGTISITHAGIKEIENLLEDSSQTSPSWIASQIKNSFKENEKIEIRENQKLRYDILKRAWDLTKGEDDVVNTFDLAASLGIDGKKELHKLERIHFYLQDEGLIKPYAIGGSFHITAKGCQRVKGSPGRIF